MKTELPSIRFYSPNLRFIVFASGQALWCRKDFAVLTEDDKREAGDILDLLMEDEAGNA